MVRPFVTNHGFLAPTHPWSLAPRSPSIFLPPLPSSFPPSSPITHVDVTFDGKWVLATTDQYLMLVKTTFKDAKGNATSGFFKSMSGSTACQPRLLQLRPEDMATVREWE